MQPLKIVNRVIEYGFYSLFFVTPLLFNFSRKLPSFELFEWNKMIFVYILTIIIAAAWVAKMILNKRIIFKRTPLDLPFAFFLIFQILSTLFSIDRHVSLFGYYSRFHGGLLSTLCYITLFYAFVGNSEQIKLPRLFGSALISGAFIASYGILEKFGIDANTWVQDVRARVFSTLGQPNWLAALLAILLPLSIAALLNQLRKKPESVITKRSWLTVLPQFLQVAVLTLLPLFYVCLLFTKSRSGFLGFWAGDLIFWITLILLNRTKPLGLIKIGLLVNISFLIINFIITTPLPLYNRLATVELFETQKPPEKAKPDLSGTSVIDVGITDSSDIRKIVWAGALEIAKAYPLFGTGPETFAYAYYKFRPVAHNLTSEWDFLYNKAHNEFLNYAATSGFVGLATYLLVIVITLVVIIKSLINSHNQGNRRWSLALLAAYLSILVTNFFGFSVVIVGLYFFLIPAFIFALNQPTQDTADHVLKLQLQQKVGLVGLSLLVLYLLTFPVRFWLADSAYAQSYGLHRQEKYTEAYDFILKAQQLRRDEPVFNDEHAAIAAVLAEAAIEKNEATHAAQLAKEAIDQSAQALTISPQNVNFWKTRTRVFYQFAALDPQFKAEALKSILIAQELAPTDAKIAYNTAVLYGDSGNDTMAIETLTKTIALKPDYRDAYNALSIFYEKNKQIDKARQTLELVLKRINPDDADVKTRLEELQKK